MRASLGLWSTSVTSRGANSCGDECGEPVVVDRQLRPDATVLAVGACTVDARGRTGPVPRNKCGALLVTRSRKGGVCRGICDVASAGVLRSGLGSGPTLG